ncbi:unnamed protein product [Polarella glacialis]|uniref:Methyltransferase FkbM domain-containing protein n=1 Tax=Polarella glacialis TaxID=89957 RepID=A0A813H5U6_POLGL|nr:unnamed protein product [Polarella glacialis]CAE8644662.1 unnamed protein product [Polarella glacialis]
MSWATAALVLGLAIRTTRSTYKGFVNPLKHLNPEDGSIFWLNIKDSEPAQDLGLAIQDFLERREEYRDTLSTLSRDRVGTERCDPLLVDTQNIWPTVQRLANAGFELSGRYVNVGASDGENDDPLFEYVQRMNATGIAVERDPERCERHHRALPQVEVACSAVTPQNVLSLVAPVLLDKTELDVLKVDIDSYDCPVIEMLLPVITAKIVLLEANPSIPPPYQWAMLHHPELWNFFNSFSPPEDVPIRGCSLAYEVELLRRYGYDLVAFGGHDAIFTHESVRSAWAPHKPPMDEFDCYNEAFIAANGISIDKTRRWFFELNDTQVGLPEVWEFFVGWMQENSPQLFPFALRA